MMVDFPKRTLTERPFGKYVFVVFCFVMFIAGLRISGPLEFFKWILLPTMGFFGWTSLYLALMGLPRLHISQEGFQIESFRTHNKVLWLDISDFGTLYKGLNPSLVFRYVNKKYFLNRLILMGFDGQIPNSSTLSYLQFRFLIVSYWEHAHAFELSQGISEAQGTKRETSEAQ